MGIETGKYWDVSWNPVKVKMPDGSLLGYHVPYDSRRVEFAIDEKVLTKPLHWKKPRTIFVCDLCDLFHEDIPIELIAEVFDTMGSARAECGKRHEHIDECWTGDPHTYLVLTKRIEEAKRVLTDYLPNYLDEYYPGDSCINLNREVGNWPLDNVWLGVTVCNQQEAYEKIPVLLSIPAAHRWISLEPMLGEIDMSAFFYLTGPSTAGPWRDVLGRRRGGGGIGGQMISSIPSNDISWVILGCESGARRRPMDLAWAENIVGQCKEAGVSCFIKQLNINSKVSHDTTEWPENLRVRQSPTWRKNED